MSLHRRSFGTALPKHLVASLCFIALLTVFSPLQLEGQETPSPAQRRPVTVQQSSAPAAASCTWTGTWVSTIKKSDLVSSPNSSAVESSVWVTSSHERGFGPGWLLLGVTVPALALWRRRKQLAGGLLVGGILGVLVGCEINLEFEEITLEMKLTQTGNNVSGTYTAAIDGQAIEGVGRIEGTISSNTLAGTWEMEDDSGEFMATMSTDCRSFVGKARQESEWLTLNWTRVSGIALYDIDSGESEGEPIWFIEAIYLNDEKIPSERAPLYKGGKITTGPGVTIKLRYQAGALAVVRENSEFEIQEIKFERPDLRTITTRLIQGILDFYTKPTYSEKFEIETNMVVVGIKGTELTVEHTSGATSVTVKEGEVEVKDKTTGTVSTIRGGETARFDGKPQPPLPGTKTIEQALDTDGDKIIGDLEILQALQLWIKQQTVPGTNQVIDDLTMLALLQKWIKGSPVQ